MAPPDRPSSADPAASAARAGVIGSPARQTTRLNITMGRIKARIATAPFDSLAPDLPGAWLGDIPKPVCPVVDNARIKPQCL
jgi:hypothetical protein